MARRELDEINAGSMADIAFLLLIFFLVTTTMDKDNGIMQLLPPPTPEDFDPPPVKEKNVFKVLANANDQLLVEGNVMEIGQLKDAVIEFYTNPKSSGTLPELQWVKASDVATALLNAERRLAADPENKEIEKEVKKLNHKKIATELIGDFKTLPGTAIISLQNDRGTSYDLYVKVQDELASALYELRDNLSVTKFNKHFNEFDEKLDADKPFIIAIREVYPSKVSEAEANSTAGAGTAPTP